jgi:hypothetical protein
MFCSSRFHTTWTTTGTTVIHERATEASPRLICQWCSSLRALAIT